MKKDEYFQLLFGSGEGSKPNERHKEAFKFAVDTRKFEIELYWKRASYFWTFIAATFTGYGVVYGSASDDKMKFLAFFLACFGFLLSLAWYFVNRGSKHWQENWECHVDYLEDEIAGSLYKTVCEKKPPQTLSSYLGFIVWGASKYSVSKINQLVSLYITLMWAVIVWNTQDNWSICTWPIVECVILVLTAFAALGIAIGARTSSGSLVEHNIYRRGHSVED